jgi:amino acid transporter
MARLRAVAWLVLLSVIAVVVVGAYLVISSTLSFFQGEASKVVGQLDSAPQLRSVLESALQFASSFVWTAFVLLVVALFVSLAVLWLEGLATR